MSDPTELYPDVFEELVRRRRAGERVVLCTVVALKGSVPRQVGARMLVLQDGSIRGTIGGGPKEGEVIGAARELLRKGPARLLELDFQAGLRGADGPICGGTMEVFMERIDPARRVVIAGAGHVGYFLHRILALLGVQTVVLDDRPEFANAERFPGAAIRIAPFEGGLTDLALTASDGIVIVTPEHRFDEFVLRQALAGKAGYIGMIGSKKKIATIFSHLRADAFAEEQIARVHAPVGLDIGAESPAEIAVAIAAEIVSAFRP